MDGMLILLWGLPEDRPLAWIGRELDRLGAPARLINQRDILSTSVDFSVADGVITGSVRVHGEELNLARVGAVYPRPHDSARLPRLARLEPGSAELRHASAADQALYSWLEITGAYVVNRPAACAANSSKPFQLSRIRRFGFRVPETLVSTDPGQVREFVKRHKDVVFKSVSAVRSQVRKLGPGDAGRLADVTTCPTQFQEWIPGTDIRVHVVGSQVFATRVSCAADDYRYAAEQGHPAARLTPATLPPDVELACLRLSAALRLPVSGIDLRLTPEGDWYCFEVNPSPAFTYYASATGQPIGRSIAALLAAAASARPQAISPSATITLGRENVT
jgi:glutathione synthase/RimK-type ligase-like ATP-grasp enzyme